MTTDHRHPVWELCEAGKRLYSQALLDDGLARDESDVDALAPCLLEYALLVPDEDEPGTLRPAMPRIALHRHLRDLENSIAVQHRHIGELADSFSPFLRMATSRLGDSVILLEGKRRIDESIDAAMRTGSGEMLTMQPQSRRTQQDSATGIARMSDFLTRGSRIRTIYTHPTRDDPVIHDLQDHFRAGGRVEVRTVDEVIDRIIIVGTEVAFVPGNPERTSALEIRHPALIMLLRSAFDRLWRYGRPYYDPLETAHEKVSDIQLRIARLMVFEGLQDKDIAAHVGVTVRTVAKHFAALADALGTTNRGQMGYMLAKAGLLDPVDEPER
ncbi:helix-turn-helix transcriptional regulator [Streptomyces sp. A7024]|uniref:Helix-turn-helix transcriptional regulator n=1 Tax=Streptomyces coryli TaxID=1128680 RepID=A0A6G4U307_9ACTN|nr:helix-turn-helix transcriptional regulator [Streptomyces coryli]NGN66615.1 helix-turn-helix transcriptional regulator [Streptomyces coryli]